MCHWFGYVALPEMARFQDGELVMRDDRTSSTRTVVVESFSLLTTPVTRAQFSQVRIGLAASASGSAPVCAVPCIGALRWCNAASIAQGLGPAYRIDDATVSWEVGSDAYRLPTEAE